MLGSLPVLRWPLAGALLASWRSRRSISSGRVPIHEVGAAVTLVALTAVKEVHEWALHVGRVFDGFTSLDAIGWFWRWLTGGG